MRDFLLIAWLAAALILNIFARRELEEKLQIVNERLKLCEIGHQKGRK